MIKQKDKQKCVAMGMRIREIRKSQGISQRQLSYAIMLDNSKISKIERGKINITYTSLLDICEGLGIHPREFMDFVVEVTEGAVER